jgi:6-pyruvoyltetrahydropterin/6-carboxytetrahydropterin synthase
MLSKHAEACRYPHGHTRRIEVVVSSERLDANDMVVDFKALKLAVGEFIDRFDHSMALNSTDPLRGDMERVYPDSTVVFEGVDPTTEVMARHIFDFVERALANGFEGSTAGGSVYRIPAGTVRLERVRVGETPQSWAEYGE